MLNILSTGSLKINKNFLLKFFKLIDFFKKLFLKDRFSRFFRNSLKSKKEEKAALKSLKLSDESFSCLR